VKFLRLHADMFFDDIRRCTTDQPEAHTMKMEQTYSDYRKR
jgi:hypothetical protein